MRLQTLLSYLDNAHVKSVCELLVGIVSDVESFGM